MSILTNSEVVFILKHHKEYSRKELVEMFNVSSKTIYSIISRKRWKHITI